MSIGPAVKVKHCPRLRRPYLPRLCSEYHVRRPVPRPYGDAGARRHRGRRAPPAVRASASHAAARVWRIPRLGAPRRDTPTGPDLTCERCVRFTVGFTWDSNGIHCNFCKHTDCACAKMVLTGYIETPASRRCRADHFLRARVQFLHV